METITVNHGMVGQKIAFIRWGLALLSLADCQKAAK